MSRWGTFSNQERLIIAHFVAKLEWY